MLPGPLKISVILSSRIQGGFAPLKSPTRDLRPLTPRLASKAIGLAASLGIELMVESFAGG